MIYMHLVCNIYALIVLRLSFLKGPCLYPIHVYTYVFLRMEQAQSSFLELHPEAPCYLASLLQFEFATFRTRLCTLIHAEAYHHQVLDARSHRYCS